MRFAMADSTLRRLDALTEFGTTPNDARDDLFKEVLGVVAARISIRSATTTELRHLPRR